VTQDRTASLFLEIFHGLPRQGPGDVASTIKALGLVPAVGRETRVLDLGCGTGFQTRVLAEYSPARFVAMDNHAPFVEEANRYARERGIADRVETRVGDMRQPGFAPGSFELIWCEGAIYVVGFDAGLRSWHPLLAPGGHMAVTEVCWSKPDPPAECAEFWAREYPAIRDPATLLTLHSKKRLNAQAVHPSSGSRVPGPAATASMGSNAIHIGRDNVRFDLVTIGQGCRLATPDGVNQAE